MAANVCRAHQNGEACSLCVRKNFDSQQMFQKRLSNTEVLEGRVYLPYEDAAKFTDSDHLPDHLNLPFYDFDEKVMRTVELHKTEKSGTRCRLSGWWRDFAAAKSLQVGDTVTFYELKCRITGARLFSIGVTVDPARVRVQVFGVKFSPN